MSLAFVFGCRSHYHAMLNLTLDIVLHPAGPARVRECLEPFVLLQLPGLSAAQQTALALFESNYFRLNCSACDRCVWHGGDVHGGCSLISPPPHPPCVRCVFCFAA